MLPSLIFTDLEEADARAELLNGDKHDLETRLHRLTDERQALSRQCTTLQHTCHLSREKSCACSAVRQYDSIRDSAVSFPTPE